MPRLNSTTIAMIAGGALVLILAVLLLLRRGDADQDKLSGDDSSATASMDPEKRCSSAKTYDLIKRELFRRAAQLRGSDQAAFESLSAYASLRMDRPVMEREDQGRNAVHCSGALSLDLPPGVAVVGGRRTLSADVDYSLQRAADNSGDVLTLSNADAVITPLATLMRTNSPRPAPADDAAVPNSADPTYDGPGEASPPTPQPVPVNPPAPPPVAQSAPAPAVSARPSFNCANARTRGERAVCSDSNLASLDRQMAAQFNRAMASASPGERAMLTRSRSTFLSFRDRCGSDACIADAYRGRMREISDIMSGRWRPAP
jgi:uncharacterized protein YecT (DUF1311 family)